MRRLTWQASPGGADVASEPTWRAGPPRRYDVAGRVWPTRDAWLTRIHIYLYTMVIVHIRLFLELANMYDMLPYLTAQISFISSVWDYVPHGFICCR